MCGGGAPAVQQLGAGQLQVPLTDLQQLQALCPGTHTQAEQLLHLQESGAEETETTFLSMYIYIYIYIACKGFTGPLKGTDKSPDSKGEKERRTEEQRREEKVQKVGNQMHKHREIEKHSAHL